ncbi:MAG: glutamate 5-kinase [Oscillospiraceae bacterium]|nr:glutamate 5-kinase [Oscillospiraceae bacterium]
MADGRAHCKDKLTAGDEMRYVFKVGTSTLIRESGLPDLRTLDRLARVLSDLRNAGNEIVLVSSGAIGVGTKKLGMAARPTELRYKQAAAAVGQCELMHLYDKSFSEYGQTVAQILLTNQDVEDELGRENLARTFDSLLELGVIPVVNENDSVSSAEIETGHAKILGDNDSLSAVVAGFCGADRLVIMTDIEGLYDGDPRDPSSRLIERVDRVTEDLYSYVGGAASKWGTGGMASKLKAAEYATARGIDTYVVSGADMDAVYDIVDGKSVGTLFSAGGKKHD